MTHHLSSAGILQRREHQIAEVAAIRIQIDRLESTKEELIKFHSAHSRNEDICAHLVNNIYNINMTIKHLDKVCDLIISKF